MSEEDRDHLMVQMRSGITGYFKQVYERHETAGLYADLAGLVNSGDTVITFDYDVALERELIWKGKFGVRTGYYFEGVEWPERDLPEQDSKVKVLKPHGSVNWVACMFGGTPGGKVVNCIGPRPFVDGKRFPLPGYEKGVLDRTFPASCSIDDCPSLILPTHDKQFSILTPLGAEWGLFYESLWSHAREALHGSSRIVLIGYSMLAVDQRARAEILGSGNRQAEVVICCGSRSSALVEDFKRHLFCRVSDNGTFEEYLKKH